MQMEAIKNETAKIRFFFTEKGFRPDSAEEIPVKGTLVKETPVKDIPAKNAGPEESRAGGMAGALGPEEIFRWREAFEKDMNLRPMEEYQGQPVYKITVACESKEDMDLAYQEFRQDFELCIQDLGGDGFVNGELVNRCFHKGKAVERVCTYLGIPVEDSMAFGDSMNDLEMIQTVGIGFCMADGNEKVKAAAAEICPPAAEDGIYRMFEKYGLI